MRIVLGGLQPGALDRHPDEAVEVEESETSRLVPLDPCLEGPDLRVGDGPLERLPLAPAGFPRPTKVARGHASAIVRLPPW